MKMYKKILIGIFIAVVSALIAGLAIEYVREQRAIPFIYEKSPSSKPIEDNLSDSKGDVTIIQKAKNEESNNPNESLGKDLDNVKFTKESWKQLYFKPVKENTWNVIVKSIGNDYQNAKIALSEFQRKYPDFHFRLTYTVAKNGKSNKMYAIYFGNGLSKKEADKIVRVAKKYHVANDAYAVKQHWDTNGEYQ